MKGATMKIRRTSFCSWEALGRKLHKTVLQTKHITIPGQRMRCTYSCVCLLCNYYHILSAVGNNNKTRHVHMT